MDNMSLLMSQQFRTSSSNCSD